MALETLPKHPRTSPSFGNNAAETTTWWEFYQDDAKQWHWQRIDRDRGIDGLCHAAYKNLVECVSDAMTHGYHYGQPMSVRASN
jgi:hypothetical protein